jgi:hypothetical protein
MDELLKILFGREPSGMGAFPIPQNPVTVEEIMPGQMPSVTNVTPSVTPAEQSRFRMPDFSGINLPEMPNLRMPEFNMPNLRMPDLSGLRMPEFNLPMPGVPEYMQGLIANPEEAQKRAQQAGLMSAAMALLESSGPSPQRTSLGQAIGRGAGAYQQGAQGSFDQILQGMLVKSKLTPELPGVVGQYVAAKKAGLIPENTTLMQYKASGSPQTNVTVNTGDKELSKTLGGAAGKRIEDSFNSALEAQNTLQNITDLRPVIKEGVFSGPLSQAPRSVAQIASSLGITGKDTNELLARTAQAMQTLANFELSAAKAMRGQGSITENERMLIQRASAGRLDQFTSTEVEALLNAMEKTANYRISSHTKQLNTVRKNAPADIAPLLNMYELGGFVPSPQAGQQQNVKKYNPKTGRAE